MSSDTIVRCADCGVPNRLFAHGSKGRYRCGRCGEVIAPARNWSAPTKLLLIACLAAFGWGAWPVSGWLALSAFAAWTLGSTAERLFPPALDQPKAIVRPTLRLTMQNLAKATAYVAIGIAIVGLAQIALSLLGGVSADALRETELFLSDMRLALNAALGVENLLIALGALVALVMIFPRSRLMAEVLRARSALGRLYLVVLGITSFTFFSAIDVKSQEENWQRQARLQAREELGKAEQLTREIVGATWTEDLVKRLTPDQSQLVARYFVQAARQASPGADITQLAHRLAKAAPSLSPKAAAPEPASHLVSKSMENHIKSRGPIREDAPTIRQVEAATSHLRTQNAKLQAVRTAVVEGVAEVFASLVADGHKPLARQMIEEVVGSVARESLGRVFPKVDNAVSARTWVGNNILSPASSEVAGAEIKWAWDNAHFEPKTAKVAPHLLPGVRPPIFGFSPHTLHGSPYSPPSFEPRPYNVPHYTPPTYTTPRPSFRFRP